jgi:ribosomal protein L11 methyltransferase
MVLELSIKIQDPAIRERCIASLMKIGFDSFFEDDEWVKAYIDDTVYNEEVTLASMKGFVQSTEGYSLSELPDINWNQAWEKNYEPVVISSAVRVRAPFHISSSKYDYELVISPQMSFGTAHHETTALMIEWMIELPFENMNVLDMGCGTGILAILANKMMAKSVTAVDNDSWAYTNALANTELNQSNNTQVILGDIETIRGHFYDRILANINRNVLLEQIPAYGDALKKDGLLLLSGFFKEDLEAIEQRCRQVNLYQMDYREKNRWVSALFTHRQ